MAIERLFCFSIGVPKTLQTLYHSSNPFCIQHVNLACTCENRICFTSLILLWLGLKYAESHSWPRKGEWCTFGQVKITCTKTIWEILKLLLKPNFQLIIYSLQRHCSVPKNKGTKIFRPSQVGKWSGFLQHLLCCKCATFDIHHIISYRIRGKSSPVSCITVDVAVSFQIRAPFHFTFFLQWNIHLKVQQNVQGLHFWYNFWILQWNVNN